MGMRVSKPRWISTSLANGNLSDLLKLSYCSSSCSCCGDMLLLLLLLLAKRDIVLEELELFKK